MGRIRLAFFELTKFSLFLALFFWVQHQLLDNKYESLLHTDWTIAHAQVLHELRLGDLERERQETQNVIARSVAETELIRRSLQDQGEMLLDERQHFERLLAERDVRLQTLIETGIDRVEGASFSSSRDTEQVRSRIHEIERSVYRRTREMKEQMVYPVVQLRGNGTVGSGVVVCSGRENDTGPCYTYVLTAYHVVMEILAEAPGSTTVDQLYFYRRGGDQLEEVPVRARLEAFHRDADIALLSVELDEPWPFIARLTDDPGMTQVSVFDSVYAVGCPLGNKPMPTVGEVSAQDKVVDGQSFWMVSAPTFFGNSGGGVYLVDSGRLIGISSMIYTYGKNQPVVVPHMGLFIPLDTIRAWLHGSGPVEVYQRIFGDDDPGPRPLTGSEAIPALAIESGATLELPAPDLLAGELQDDSEDR